MSSKKRTWRRVIGFLLVFAAAAVAYAGDWPTWRCNAERTGATASALPDRLHLQWRRDLPPAETAWPYEPRMQFDPCYEPVVLGKTLFVASPNHDSVTAYDTDTGKRKWRYFTNAPVRFAPVACQGRVYAASDDGRVYCLDAETGKVQWIFRAAPKERPDLFHLGNNRLVSVWPVRGGPVLADGVLYVGSGIWPTMGTFVYALDAKTGQVVWSNDRLNYMTRIRSDHNRIADSALAPQGYLVLSGGTLLVPNGRSMPVGLDPKTGALRYYIQGYRHGACRVTAHGKYIYVGRQAALDIRTGREVGERWHEGQPETPKEYSPRYDLFESPFVPYKHFHGCNAWSVLGPGVVYGAHHGTFYAYDVDRAKKSTYKRKILGHELAPGKWDVPTRWTLRTEHAPKKWLSDAIIQAGNRLYGHAGKFLMAVNIPPKGGKAKAAWEMKLPGTPAGMLAADNRLFIATREGHLLCLGEKEVEPVTHALPNTPLRQADDEWGRRAEAILDATQVKDGYCIVLGLKQGRLVEELLLRSKLRVIAVDGDRAVVDALRDRLVAAGLYGTRAQVLVGDPARFAFPHYIASLIVSECYDGPQIAKTMHADRIPAMLRPYGGTACFPVPTADRPAFKQWLSSIDLENGTLSETGKLCLLTRVGPLPDSAPWTHECAAAARTYFSKDKRVKPPLGVLWYGDGPGQGFKKHKDYHHGVKPQVVNGGLYAFDERRKVLQAYDVYTGRVLWQREADAFTRFASMPDGIYVAGGNACLVLDPATGRRLKRFPYHVGEDKNRELFVGDIKVGDDVIVVGVDFGKVRKIAQGLYDSKVLIGLDRQTGKMLWTRTAKDRFTHHALAVGGGRVYCMDSPSNKATGEMKRRGNPPKTLEVTVLALEARTGKAAWQKTSTYPFSTYGEASWTLQARDDALSYSEECDVLIVYKEQHLTGLRGATGKVLWEREKAGGQPIIVKGEIYYNQGGAAFDVQTGKPVPSKARVQGGHGCNHGVAGEFFFFRRHFTAAYFDMQTGRAYHMRSARSGCTNSLIAADGVLSSPCFSVGCICNHPVETSFCLVHMPEVEGWEGDEPVREPLPLGERDPAKWRKLQGE